MPNTPRWQLLATQPMTNCFSCFSGDGLCLDLLYVSVFLQHSIFISSSAFLSNVHGNESRLTKSEEQENTAMRGNCVHEQNSESD